MKAFDRFLAVLAAIPDPRRAEGHVISGAVYVKRLYHPPNDWPVYWLSLALS